MTYFIYNIVSNIIKKRINITNYKMYIYKRYIYKYIFNYTYFIPYLTMKFCYRDENLSWNIHNLLKNFSFQIFLCILKVFH